MVLARRIRSIPSGVMGPVEKYTVESTPSIAHGCRSTGLLLPSPRATSGGTEKRFCVDAMGCLQTSFLQLPHCPRSFRMIYAYLCRIASLASLMVLILKVHDLAELFLTVVVGLFLTLIIFWLGVAPEHRGRG